MKKKNPPYFFHCINISLLPKDHYFIWGASLVQDYYPDMFLIMMVNVDMKLKDAVILQIFWNIISEAESDFVISVAFTTVTQRISRIQKASATALNLQACGGRPPAICVWFCACKLSELIWLLPLDTQSLQTATGLIAVINLFLLPDS